MLAQNMASFLVTFSTPSSSSESPAKKKIKVSVAKDMDKSSHNTSSSTAAVAAAAADDDDELLNSILSSSSPTSSEDAEKAAAHGDPPDPEELIKALQELENAASSDAIVRERIAKLPSSVSEVSQLDNLKTPEEGRKLLQKVRDSNSLSFFVFMNEIVVKVEEATVLLQQYNDRLQQELKDRKRIGKMVSDFLAAQKFLESQAEERLEQFKDKLDKVNTVRSEIRSHIQSLPDLTKLPDVTTGGLAPLPSAGDLFTANK